MTGIGAKHYGGWVKTTENKKTLAPLILYEKKASNPRATGQTESSKGIKVLENTLIKKSNFPHIKENS